MTKAFISYRLKNKVSWFTVFSLCIVLGICSGALCCAYANEATDSSLYTYLNNFFSGFSAQNDYMAIFKRALSNHSKIFITILLSGFFSAGAVISSAGLILNGFVCGFTAAAFIKYFGMKGLLLNAAYLPSYIVFIPVIIIFASVAAKFSVNKYKKEKKILAEYILFSLVIYIALVLSALAEGYITAILIKTIIT